MGTPQPDAILGLVYQGVPEGTAGWVCKALENPKRLIFDSFQLHRKKMNTRNIYPKRQYSDLKQSVKLEFSVLQA